MWLKWAKLVATAAVAAANHARFEVYYNREKQKKEDHLTKLRAENVFGFARIRKLTAISGRVLLRFFQVDFLFLFFLFYIKLFTYNCHT